MKNAFMFIIGLFICISRTLQDACTYHDPEEGFGHVAYSKTMPLREIAREAVNECEAVHGEDQCDLFCFESRDDHADDL